ncbi:MAG: sodium:proton antiporter [Bacteroidales bacterium]|nr:sodium:proton antiporter [Candidatus Liminaster caballi]
MQQRPNLLLSLVPLMTLVAMLAVSITLFGEDSLGGPNQISLLMASAVCISIAIGVYKVRWKKIEKTIEETIGSSSVSIVILLLIGMMSGAWMVSGAVPTLIYYGVQVLAPEVFLLCTCAICTLVSVMTGSSWTTIATIGVALLGIGEALGVDNAWTAGAIISGAYFGDKISPLSDTTVLASSAAQVDVFVHIRYMMKTTVPTFGITLAVFLVAGLCMDNVGNTYTEEYTDGLSRTFNISAWTMLVPVLTGVLIVKKVPALVTLFVSGIAAGVMAVILQPEIVAGIAGSSDATSFAMLKGVMITFCSSTSIDAHNAALNDLIATRGMSGMLDTVWLILCAMCFGGAMTATGMLQCIVDAMARAVRGPVSLVGCTAATGISLNTMTSDQYMSIVLTANMYRDVYKKMGLEGRLLSRTTEDSTTVTSVLIPWNTCGMTQSTVLGVATLSYLPYCVFNYLSPLMTIIITARMIRREKKRPK